MVCLVDDDIDHIRLRVRWDHRVPEIDPNAQTRRTGERNYGRRRVARVL